MAEELQPHWADILKRRLVNFKKGEIKCKLMLHSG